MMRRFLAFTRAQAKRAALYLPFVFLVTLVLCLCLAFALLTTVSSDKSKADQQKISIGVVGDFKNSYLDLGVSAIKSFDSSRFSLDLIELDENEARSSLLKGRIAGYVVITEEFVNEAIYGNVGKISFVTTDANADIINVFKQEVLELISSVLVESQNGVYGLQDAMRHQGNKWAEIEGPSNELTAEYVGLILNRSNALDVEIIGVSDNLSFGGYMFSGLSVLLILLSGIVTCPLFIKRDMALPKLLSANRHSALSQIAGEYLAFFGMMLINTVLLLFLLMIGAGRISGAIPELAELGISEMLLILIKFIPAIALITALQFLMYQLSDSIVSGVLMQFISAVFLGYISGCFYPISFFPKAIRILSDLIPSGIARGYFSSLLVGDASLLQLITILLYFLALMALSVFVRHGKIKTA